MSVTRILTSRRNRRMVYLMLLSFLTSLMGFMSVQVFGVGITHFSEWTMTQSEHVPPLFPFIGVPEYMIYSFFLMLGAFFFVWLLLRLRLIK